MCLGAKCNAMEGTGLFVKTKIIVTWEAQAGEVRLKMKCYVRPWPVCLGSKYSAMGGLGRCVYAQM